MSNPWPHRSRRFDPERGQYVSRPGEDVADDVSVTWSSALAEAGHSLDEIDACAARVRDGARAACKRLRGERDEARAGYRWTVEHAADQKLDGYRELGARAAAAENERDAARLELRALEWLTAHSRAPVLLGPGSCSVGTVMRGRESYSTWSAAARALGWEG